MPGDLRLVVVTPERTLLDEPVRALRFPLYDGQIGILPGRAPLVGRLGYGELKVDLASGASTSYFIDGGFVQVKGPVVSILTHGAIPASELKAAQAQAELDAAMKMEAHTDLEFAMKERAQERARRKRELATH